jgi:hypothetical protein
LHLGGKITMSEELHQKIGDIEQSEKVGVLQNIEKDSGIQEIGNIKNSKDVNIQQAMKAVEQIAEPSKYIASLQEGLKEYNEQILPQLALVLGNYQQLHQEIQELVGQLANSDVNPQTKLKLTIPLIPVILAVESEYNLSEKMKQLKNRFSESSIHCYEKMIKTFLELKTRLGL